MSVDDTRRCGEELLRQVRDQLGKYNKAPYEVRIKLGLRALRGELDYATLIHALVDAVMQHEPQE